MYKTIVVPVDGSEAAVRAVPIGSWLADRFGAELHLVTTTFAADTVDADEVLRRAVTYTEHRPLHTDVIHHSFPAQGVLDVVDADDEALLCLSTRGATALHALLLGSVSDEVVRQSPGPLVLVGPHCAAVPDNDHHILVCVDGSETSAAVLPVVADWAVALGLDTEVVIVADAHSLASFRTSTQAHVDRAAEVLRTAGATATVRIEESTTPAKAIVELANATDASIIALATQGAEGLFAEALGHVATEVVRHAGVPVLVVPVRDDR